MILDEKLRQFLQGPVMQVLCVGDADGRPVIARGCGLLIDADGHIELLLSTWQWPRAASLLRRGCAIAVTFMQPASYECYQIKGDAAVVAATGEHIDAARRYIAQTFASLRTLGLPRPLDDAYFTYADPIVLRIKPERIYVQTPGAGAGRAWG